MAIDDVSKPYTDYYEALSSETKPDDVKITSILIETDTGNRYEYRGPVIGWVQI